VDLNINMVIRLGLTVTFTSCKGQKKVSPEAKVTGLALGPRGGRGKGLSMFLKVASGWGHGWGGRQAAAGRETCRFIVHEKSEIGEQIGGS
jgi:hypothetical protein